MLSRLREGLKKTRERLSLQFQEAFSGKTVIDEDLFEELEAAMLQADLGVATTTKILEAVGARVREERIASPETVRALVLEETRKLIRAGGDSTADYTTSGGPFVCLVVGVNGVGKTTTIGKLAKYHAANGRRVILCAGDTFRAAAVEQLAEWADRAGARLISQKEGADPAAVVFDAVEASIAAKADVLIIDTAGRLHTKDHLMLELEKVRRVVAKRVDGGPHETLLILDGTTGQNAVSQVREFASRIGVTGLVVTKLDGTAKGGVIASIVSEFDVPVRFIGLGEQIDDLIEFEAESFADALFS